MSPPPGPQTPESRQSSLQKRLHPIRQRDTPTRRHGPDRQARDEDAVSGLRLDIGIMGPENSFLSYCNLQYAEDKHVRITASTHYKQLDIEFKVTQTGVVDRRLRCRAPFSQIKRIIQWQNADDSFNILVELSMPPVITRAPTPSRQNNASRNKSWPRQGGVFTSAEKRALANARLDVDYDLGRWLCYRIVTTAPVGDLCKLLSSCGVCVSSQLIDVSPGVSGGLLHRPSLDSEAPSTLAALHREAETTPLPFEVLYQLEACFSHGFLLECSMTAEFLQKLASMSSLSGQNAEASCKRLEQVMLSKRRFTDPMQIFKLQMPASYGQDLPAGSTIIRSVTVTPTTTYFHSPMVDTSNRVLRKYRHLSDRFLRVRFRDELYKGRLYGDEDCDELFTRVKYVLMYGIDVGARHFEFLAYGNSQLREQGAYFFSPTYDVSADDIRREMGAFDSINVVAKYAARLGQSFSTTRTTTNSVQIVDIPDITHNGYCFTDGVGKISLFLAQMIAQDMKLPTSTQRCPSVYQFRLAGCKGVLAVDPRVKGAAVHIRPSQNKFPAKHRNLEICRYSRFSASYLNQLIVLVLSALGVPDEVFLDRMRRMLSAYEGAMIDSDVALKLLQHSVDMNHITPMLAHMIDDGFMDVQEPFLMSCLHLWRSWSVKFLQEKARILIEDGAFLLGCVDEYNVLQGHTENTKPEIFVQVTDFSGGYKVIEGICIVARNPSVHPGDIRLVRAVDRPELRHLRDVVVFPQNGDRDVPSMCSGGDLDGDDFLVIWDSGLLPTSVYPAMDYTAPEPVTSNNITVESLINFFVQHMKYDNLGRIATAHRYWADQLEGGVKSDKCLQLAALHSAAVDYAKTGVPAPMPASLKTVAWPHWAQSNVARKKVYHSKKVLGQLYDQVQRVPYEPTWEPFDRRILEAYAEMPLEEARQLKQEYDDAVRKVMDMYGIASELEVWTSFVLDYNNEVGEYKLAEKLGDTMSTLKQQYREAVLGKKLGPFVAAMYAVTAQEIAEADRDGPMPFISFPWLFARELGQIANGRIVESLKGPGRVTKIDLEKALTGPEGAGPAATATDLPYQERPAAIKLNGQVERAGMMALESLDCDDDTTASLSGAIEALPLPDATWSIASLMSKAANVDSQKP